MARSYMKDAEWLFTSGGGGGGPPSNIWLRIGRRNAAVFPDPVWAHAITSRFPRIIGIEYFCTGVGLEYWASYVC